jgi:hypothetical protein
LQDGVPDGYRNERAEQATYQAQKDAPEIREHQPSNDSADDEARQGATDDHDDFGPGR